MSDNARRELLEVQAFFRLPSVGLVEKDLHVVRAIAALAAIDMASFDLVDIAALARLIAESDAQEFASQYPAYAADIAGETCKALDALRTDPLHQRRYAGFVAAMVYGERPEFGEALATVVGLAEAAWRP